MKQYKFKHWTIEIKRHRQNLYKQSIQRRCKIGFEFIQLCRSMRRIDNQKHSDRKYILSYGTAYILGILVKYIEAYSKYYKKRWSRRKCYDLAHMIRESLLC